MDNKSLELLEFPKVRDLIAGYTSFEASRELALAIQPMHDRDTLESLLQQSAEARQLYTEDRFSIGQVLDIREASQSTALGKILDPLVLLDIQQTLSALHQVHRGLSRYTETYPRLWHIASKIVDTPEIEKEIGHCISPNGDVLDSASPRLGDIRRRLRKTRDQLVTRLEATLKSAKGSRIVQEPIITEREGRYVIPIKVEYRKDIRGIVHDMSNTGATLFIEPWTTLELGNEVRQLISEEKNEIERILHEISFKIASRAPDIANNIRLVAQLDLILAKAKFASSTGAVEPSIIDPTDSTSILRLVEARHPLIGEKAVPLSVEIGREFSVLVITGPNMGGKTVALKTIGLLSVMALSGLPIPADKTSAVPLFDGVFADIGDEQSIEETMSTFSWHVGNIVRIMKNSSSRSLVLLDELGASTDPAEGSALARSILLHLLSQSTLAVATTHYDDLKAFAHVTPGLKNASLDLDPVTGMPTYHLTLGIPGGSNALTVAEHLGMPVEIIQTARRMLGEGTQVLDALLEDLARERSVLNRSRIDIENERKKIDRQKLDTDARLNAVIAEERKLKQITHDNVVREAAELQRDIRAVTVELRKSRSHDTVEKAKATLASIHQRLQGDIWQQPAAKIPVETAETTVEDASIKPGDTVLLKEANLKATVISVSSNSSQAEVQAGRAKMTLSLNSLEKIIVTAGSPKPKYIPVTKQVSKPVSLQIDLRGKRASEIEPELDSYINNASVAGLSEIRIIHGMATGTVRKIVREFLATHPLVRSFQPGGQGEGGDGATIVKL